MFFYQPIRMNHDSFRKCMWYLHIQHLI